MTASVVHLDTGGVPYCRRREPPDALTGLVSSEWPEHVTCNAACAQEAKTRLILADRERVAWNRSRTIIAGPLSAFLRVTNTGDVFAEYALPALLSRDDLRTLEALTSRAAERADLLVARQRHRERYARPGAPDDPEACQHAAIRGAPGGQMHCWTCDGRWQMTAEGIAQAANAAAEGVA